MTVGQLDLFIADVRAQVDEELARFELLDWSAMPPNVRVELEAVREQWLELRATLTDEAIAAELEATEHAGRDLTPAEVAGLVRRQ